MWHRPGADQSRSEQTNRERQLGYQRETSAPLGVREFVDIRVQDRDFATETDTLQESQPHQRLKTPGESTDEAENGKDCKGDQGTWHTTPALGEPPKEQRADRLANVANRNQRSDLQWGELP